MDHSMVSGELALAKQEFLNFISRLNPSVSKDLLDWIIEQRCGNTNENTQQCCNDFQRCTNAEENLKLIIEDLRTRLPISGMCGSETLFTPENGQNADCDPATTVVIDSFLYDDDDVDKLCDENLLTRNYCTTCGSRDTKPLTFISHSMSVLEIRAIFQEILPKLITDFRNKILVDIGSRLGAVLYGAYYFSLFEKIIGIEMNSELFHLQLDIINKYKMTHRIQTMHNDVNNIPDLLQQADVIILNNTFEFFLSKEAQINTWLNIRKNICKQGSILVTVPSVEESLCLGDNSQLIFDVKEWLDPLRINFSEMGAEYSEDELDELTKLNFYKVK